MGARMLLSCVDDLAKRREKMPSTLQTGEATYAPLLTKNHGRVDWTQTAKEIDQQIRGLNPWPGVWTMNGDKRLKILAARTIPQSSEEPAGTLLNKDGHIACGQGSILALETIQPEGKKPMDITSALNGGYIKVGSCLT